MIDSAIDLRGAAGYADAFTVIAFASFGLRVRDRGVAVAVEAYVVYQRVYWQSARRILLHGEMTITGEVP